jgi:hypothetical protein
MQRSCSGLLNLERTRSLHHNLLKTNVTELRPSWEADICAAIQEFPNNLWNPKVHYDVHKNFQLAPILSQINPVYTTPPISLLSSHLRLGLPVGLFPSGFLTKILHAFLLASYVLHAPMLGGSLVTTAWRVLRLRMEGTPSRYGG